MGGLRTHLDFRFLRNFLINLRRTHNRVQELFAAQLIFISIILVPIVLFNLIRGDYAGVFMDILYFTIIYSTYRLSFRVRNTFALRLVTVIIYSTIFTTASIFRGPYILFALFPFTIAVATFFRRNFLWLAPILAFPPLLVPVMQGGVNRFVAMFVGSFLLFCMLLYEFFLMEEDEKNALTRLAEQDALTGAGNRAALERVLRNRHEGPSAATPVSVLMFDVDNFKHVNDAYGHPTGDLVLSRFASLVREAAAMSGRTINLYRLGGDEFCALLFQDGDSAKEFVASLIERISRQSLVRETAVSVSAGIAELARGETYRAGYLRADKALLKAKADGKARLRWCNR